MSYFISFIQIFLSVDIKETEQVGIYLANLFFGEKPYCHIVEEAGYLQLVGEELAANGFEAGAGVCGVYWFGSAVQDRRYGVIRISGIEQSAVESRVEEWHIASAENGPVGRGGSEAGIDSAKGAFAGVFVNDWSDIVGKIEFGDALGVVGDHDDIGRYFPHSANYASDERLALKRFESLVASQALAHAASEDNSGYF